MQFIRRNRPQRRRASTNDTQPTSQSQSQSQTIQDSLSLRRLSTNSPSDTPRSQLLNTDIVPPELLRSLSEETLTTSTSNLINDSGNYISGPITDLLLRNNNFERSLSNSSIADTIVELVLGHNFIEFNEVRQLPVTSILFQKGIFVFPSEESLSLFKSYSRNVPLELRKKGLGVPILQCITPMLSTFKRSSPIMLFYKYNSPMLGSQCFKNKNDNDVENPKVEYCRVYFKYFRDGTCKYYLRFAPNGDSLDPSNFEVILVSSSKTPCFDTKYRNTRMRWLGTTLSSSTYGSGFFKLQILTDDSPSLLDDLDFQDPLSQPSKSSINSVSNDFLAQLSSFPPVARFSDHESTTIPKKLMNRHGDVRLIEISNDQDKNSINSITECSLVLTIMSLVIRDQEVKKSYGASRTYDSSASANVFY